MFNRFLRMWRACLPFVVLLPFFCLKIPLRAEQYQAEGEIAYFAGTNHVQVFTRPFQLTVSNCNWSIRVYVKETSDPTTAKRFEVVHDGQSVYYYTHLGIPDGAPVANKGVGEIDGGCIPFENASFANYVWLGLASSCVFTQSGRFEMQAPWLLRDAKPKSYTTEVVLADASLHLPERITYKEHPGVRPSPFENGWMVGEMRVLSRTNVGPLTVPDLFVFEQFKPKPGASKPDDLKSQYQVKVAVTSLVIPSEAEVIPPRSDGATLVHDRRLAVPGGVSGITYLSTNATMPRSPDLAVRKEFQKLSQIQLATGRGSNSARVKRAVILCFMVSFGIGVLILVKQMKSRHHKSGEKI